MLQGAGRLGTAYVCLRIGSVLGDDDPMSDPRHMKKWLSQRDLIQLVGRSLGSNMAFGIYCGVSNNQGKFRDIAEGRLELGYAPLDDACRYPQSEC
jgi:hypothetical protein